MGEVAAIVRKSRYETFGTEFRPNYAQFVQRSDLGDAGRKFRRGKLNSGKHPPVNSYYRPRGCGEVGFVAPHASTVNPPGATVPSELTKATLSTTRFSGGNTRLSSWSNRREKFLLVI